MLGSNHRFPRRTNKMSRGTATEHLYDGVPYEPPALVRVSAEPSLLSHSQWVEGRDKEETRRLRAHNR
jgi:hypothetical protein